MRISDWSSDVCSSDLDKRVVYEPVRLAQDFRNFDFLSPWEGADYILPGDEKAGGTGEAPRSEEHTSELQSLMRISYAVLCLKKKKTTKNNKSKINRSGKRGRLQ